MIKKMMLAAACTLLMGFQGCDSSGSNIALYRINYVAIGAHWGRAPVPGVFFPGTMAKVSDNTGYMGRVDGQTFVGWNTLPTGSGTNYSVGSRFPINTNLTLYAQWRTVPFLDTKKSFYAQDLVDNSWYTVNAVKLAEGDHCIVYADIYAFLTIEESWGSRIVDEYNKSGGIYDKITGVFRHNSDFSKTIEDVDGNGKVIFLLLDIQDGFTGTGGYVAGYFHSYHMFASSTDPYSNQADMLFMDVNPGRLDSTFYSTMAHELQHLINWSIGSSGTRSSPTDTWLDEGLAAAAEYIYGGENTSKINYFNGDPNQTIANGNNFFYWNIYGNTWDNDVLADYATAYLFFRWLGIHGGGNGIYTGIINSTYGDYRAVTANASAIATGIDAGASTTEAAKWNALLSGWMRANMTGAGSGYFGYLGQVVPHPQARYFTGTNNQSVDFYPGEGIFSEGSNTPSASGTIKYVGNIPVSNSGVYVLLTYNGSTDKSGNSESGRLANTTGGVMAIRGAQSDAGSLPSLPATYPIGFRDVAGERGSGGKRSGKAGVK
jgi:hypothetical protein